MNTYKEALDALKSRRTRKLENNTYLERRDNSTIAVRLHATDVVTYHADDSVTLKTGGWYTVTTKNRINKYAPIAISQRKGVWHIWQMTDNGWQYLARFFDGVTVKDGNVINGGKAQ